MYDYLVGTEQRNERCKEHCFFYFRFKWPDLMTFRNSSKETVINFEQAPLFIICIWNNITDRLHKIKVIIINKSTFVLFTNKYQSVLHSCRSFLKYIYGRHRCVLREYMRKTMFSSTHACLLCIIHVIWYRYYINLLGM